MDYPYSIAAVAYSPTLYQRMILVLQSYWKPWEVLMGMPLVDAGGVQFRTELLNESDDDLIGFNLVSDDPKNEYLVEVVRWIAHCIGPSHMLVNDKSQDFPEPTQNPAIIQAIQDLDAVWTRLYRRGPTQYAAYVFCDQTIAWLTGSSETTVHAEAKLYASEAALGFLPALYCESHSRKPQLYANLAQPAARASALACLYVGSRAITCATIILGTTYGSYQRNLQHKYVHNFKSYDASPRPI